MCSVQYGEAPTVRVVSSLFRELCYNNKDALQAGIIGAGWDKYHGVEVYSVPLGGSLHQQPFAIGGSGSTFIYGFCDAEYKENMTRDECISFVSRGKARCLCLQTWIYNLNLFPFLSIIACNGS